MRAMNMSINFRTPAERTRHLLSGLLFGLLVAMMAFSSVGCSKKKDGNNNGYNNGYGYGNYPGYGNGQMVGAAVGNSTYQGIQLALEFQSVNGAQPYGGGGAAYYNGSVVAYGQLYVNQPVQCGYGYIQPGQYNIQAVQPGTLSNGLISNMQIMAVGPGGQIPITMSVATVLPSYPKQFSCGGMQIYDELSGVFNIGGCSVYVDVLSNPSICY